MNGWMPGAMVREGPASKTNGAPRIGRGAVWHSAEGSLAGALGQLTGINTGVSWHFTVALNGTIYQHYPAEMQCWHAHAAGNLHYIGIEHENAYTNGAPNHDPETDAQVAADVAILRWLEEGPYQRGVSLWEHHEVPGNQTTCPNGRARWDDIAAALRPPTIVGIGVRLDDGTDLGNILPPLPDGRTVAGVGAALSDGSEPRLWPK